MKKKYHYTLWTFDTLTTEQQFFHYINKSVCCTCLVAASERFLRVQRQFWTRRWLGSVRWSPKACMPPAHTSQSTTNQFIASCQRTFTLAINHKYKMLKTSNNSHIFTAIDETRTFTLMHFSLFCVSIPFLNHDYVRTSFYDGRLVAWANREHFEHSACGPQQFLICEGPHDVDQGLGTATGQNDQLKQKQVYV